MQQDFLYTGIYLRLFIGITIFNKLCIIVFLNSKRRVSGILCGTCIIWSLNMKRRGTWGGTEEKNISDTLGMYIFLSEFGLWFLHLLSSILLCPHLFSLLILGHALYSAPGIYAFYSAHCSSLKHQSCIE